MIFKEDDFVELLLARNWKRFFSEMNEKYQDVFQVHSYSIESSGRKTEDVVNKKAQNLAKLSIQRIFENNNFQLDLNCEIHNINEAFVKNYLKLEIDQFITKVLNKHLEFHIYKDDLTEVQNYRCLYKDVKFQIEHCRAENKKFTLVFVDLDNFKSINDRHGHIVGSSLLKQLSEKLIKYNDLNEFKIYRYGGDEFVFLCEESDTQEADRRVSRVLQKLAKDKFQISEGNERAIELSVGFAEFPKDGETFQDIVDIADKMMYEAKKQGKYQTNIRIKRFKESA